MRIALAQINPTVGDLKQNFSKIKSFIEQSKREGSDIVVFPELSLSGYPPEDLLLKPHFIMDNFKNLELLKKESHGIVAIIGFPYIDKKGVVYNSAAVLTGGRIKAIYHKNILPNYSVFDEKRYFQQSKENMIFKLAGLYFGVNICEDIWLDSGPHIDQARAGAGILINLSASPYHMGKGELRYKLLSGRARETKSFICYANIVGGQDELVFDGSSLILDKKGKILARGKEFEEDLIIADIDDKKCTRKKRTVKGVKLVNLAGKTYTKSQITDHSSPPIPKKLGEAPEVYKALVLSTRDYVLKNKFQKVIISISGGIDSAITLAIASSAIGKDNVFCITMPSQFSSKETISDSKKVCRNFGVKLVEIPIENIYQTYRKLLEEKFNTSSLGVAGENIQARIRGNIVMAFSNKYGWLVLTTGNKSETAVGYCTLYGDMAGGFGVIKDVPKTLVYKLANFVNKEAGRDIIPDSIIKRPPSAELAPGQKDTDSLPEYDILDPILKSYIEDDRSFDEMLTSYGKAGSRGSVSKELLRKVISMVDKNEYKRRQSPPGPRITPKAFGKDRRLPITNLYI